LLSRSGYARSEKAAPNLPDDALEDDPHKPTSSAVLSEGHLRAHPVNAKNTGQEKHDDQVLTLFPDIAAS